MASLAIQKDEIQSTAQVIPFRYQANAIRACADGSGSPWFVASDVCGVLGYKNVSRTIGQHCRAEGVTKRYTPSPSGNQEMIYIDEGNLYRLIIKSNKPEAEPFERWVCDEVLPSIRKNGQFIHENLTITPEQQNALQQIVARKTGDDGNKRAALWSRFNNHYKLGSYKQLPASKFPDAVVYLDSIAEDAPALPFPETIRMLAVFEGSQMVKARQLNSKEVVMDVSDDKSLRTVFAEYLPLDKLSMLIRMATDRLEMAAQRSIQKRLK